MSNPVWLANLNPLSLVSLEPGVSTMSLEPGVINRVVLTPEFRGMGKTPRLFGPCTITEKIDGTSALVYVSDDLSLVLAGSRTRWLSPEAGIENHGFGAWVNEHTDELRGLGPGYHHGEWYGAGIQRRYGLAEKRLALFNVYRWNKPEEKLPACCTVVPLIHGGLFSTERLAYAISALRETGSFAAPGFMDPEGVVVNMGGRNFKYTLDGDGHKGSKATHRESDYDDCC